MATVTVTETLIPNILIPDSSSYAVTNPTNFYTPSSSTTYASASSFIPLYNFDFSSLPEDAEIESATTNIRVYSGSNYNQLIYIGIYWEGSMHDYISDGVSVTYRQTKTIESSISVSNVEKLKDPTKSVYLCAYNSSNNGKVRTLRMYGAELTVTYTTEYTPPTDTLYYKSNGSWVEASNAYKKINGVWVEQSDLTTVFNAQTNYVKGN